MGSGGGTVRGVSTPHGSGYRKSRFQPPGIRVHTGVFSVHFENFSLPPAANSFARWDNETGSPGVEIPHATHSTTHEL